MKKFCETKTLTVSWATIKISKLALGHVVGKTFCKMRLIKLLKPAGHVMHHQFNIQQLYVLPTLYLYVLYLSENKQRLVPLTA